MNRNAIPIETIYWLGGSPCSGKTSVAHELARRYHLPIYHCDDHVERHLHTANPELHPTLYRYPFLNREEAFLQPLNQQLVDAFAFCSDQFSLIMDDLQAHNSVKALIVEGTALIPPMVQSVLGSKDRCFWLVPTEDFQREFYPRHSERVNEILARCKSPRICFRNWMDRDAAFAEQVARYCEYSFLPILWNNGKQSIPDLAKTIQHFFQLEAKYDLNVHVGFSAARQQTAR